MDVIKTMKDTIEMLKLEIEALRLTIEKTELQIRLECLKKHQEEWREKEHR